MKTKRQNRDKSEAVAEILKTTRATKETAEIALKLADLYENESPSFKREKFLRACKF